MLRRANIISKLNLQWKRVEYLLIKEEEASEHFRSHSTHRSPKHSTHRSPKHSRSPLLKKLNSHGKDKFFCFRDLRQEC